MDHGVDHLSADPNNKLVALSMCSYFLVKLSIDTLQMYGQYIEYNQDTYYILTYVVLKTN